MAYEIESKFIDPDEDLDFGFDWENWLASGDSVSTSSWNVTEGTGTELSLHDDAIDTAVTSVFIDPDETIVEDGDIFTITNTIVTTGSRTAERSFYLSIMEK